MKILTNVNGLGRTQKKRNRHSKIILLTLVRMLKIIEIFLQEQK